MLRQVFEGLGLVADRASMPGVGVGARSWFDVGVGLRRLVFGLLLAGLVVAAIWLARHGYSLVQVITALLIGLGVVLFLLQSGRGKWTVAIALLLVVPLFFRVGGTNPIDLPESSFNRLSGQTLPVGALLAVLIGMGLLLRGGLAALDRQRAVFWAIGVFLLSGLLLLVVGFIEHGRSVGPLFFVQLSVPLFAILPGLYAADRPNGTRHVVALVKWGLLLSCLAILIQTIIHRGPAGLFGEPLLVRFGPLNIYQEADYVPFVFGIALLFVAITEAHVRKIAWHDLVYVFIVGLIILGLYSRGAILTVAVGMTAAILLARREYQARLARLAMVFLLVYVAGTVLGINGVQRINATVVEIASSMKIASSAETSSSVETASAANVQSILDSDRSLRHRYLGARQALAHLRYHPISGSAFGRPTVPEELMQEPIFTGKRNSQYLGVTEFGSPHNQYLDITLRGGLLWLTAFLALVFTATWRIWKTSRTTNSPVSAGVGLAVVCVLLSTALASNFYQHNFAQPFSGFFLWYLVGVGLAARDFPGSSDCRGRD